MRITGCKITAFAVVAFAAFGTPPAQASHTVGGSYKGVGDYGSIVEFAVNPSGTEVLSFSFLPGAILPGSRPDGSYCETHFTVGSGVSPRPVIDHAFEYAKTEPEPNTSPPVLSRFAGSFTTEGHASGTFQLFDRRFGPECASVVIPWTAEIPGFDAQMCELAKEKVRVAKRKLHNADGAAAKRRAQRRLERAKAEREEACA